MVAFYEADVHFASDYFPFGMQMKERTFAAQDYTYGFNGQEQDGDLMDGAVVFKYRIHDPRIGRFLSVDPLAPEYPWNSAYAFAENQVISSIDLEGAEAEYGAGGFPTKRN
jgi:RHS repeat-associated protein